MSLAPGSYAVAVTAYEITEEALFEDPDAPTPVAVGGCGATLVLVPEHLTVRVTAAMAWDQPACGVVIDPRIPLDPERSGPVDAVRLTGQPPRFRARGAPDATVTDNGIRLELWVEDPTLDPGQWLLAHLRVTNVSRRPIGYIGRFDDLRCPPLRFTLDTSDLFDPGRTWTGVAAEFKRSFMDDGLLQRVPLGIPARDRGPGCGEVGYGGRLEPGAVVEVPLAAMPRYALRAQPLPPGTLHLSAAFRGRRGTSPDLASVTTDVTLDGEAVAYPSPGQLVDAALSTPGLIESLALAPDPDAWFGANDAWWPERSDLVASRLAGALEAPRGIVEIGQFVGSDIDRPFVVGAVIDPWTGESFGSYWFWRRCGRHGRAQHVDGRALPARQADKKAPEVADA